MKNWTYIIVDDEPLIRRGVEKKVEACDLGLNLTGEADNGLDGLKLIRRLHPDIVFTDMRMPVLDGRHFLQAIRDNYPEQIVIVISGYSDFEYMKAAILSSAISYLLKPFDVKELKDALEKALRQAENRRDLNVDRENVLIRQDDLAMLDFIQGYAGDLPRLQSAGWRETALASSYQMLLRYSAEPGNDVKGSSMNCHPLNLPGSNSLTAFILTGPGLPDQVLQLTEASPDIWSLSRVKANFHDLPQALTECLEALDSRSITQGIRLVEATVSETTVPEETRWEKTDQLLFSIESGQTEAVTQLGEDFFRHFEVQPQMPIGRLKKHCAALIHEIRTILYAYVSEDFIRKNNAAATIERLYDYEAVRRFMLNLIANSAKALAPYRVYGSQDTISNIRQYIERNYMRDIKLEVLASLFFINSSYCSHLFKKHMGVNMIDYLNQVRIDKARELLRYSNLKSYQIARQVGFSNEKYFFRVFKKLTGKTPENYRIS